MGPVGMLCVQRTLNDGRPHGIVTGLGAAAGDVIYALITVIGALGLGFIVDYIEQHQAPFQIGGSIVLVIFGYIVYNQNPSKRLTKFAKAELPVGKVFVSSLALTLSNIGMLFLYMALFARFNILDTNEISHSLMVIPAIGVGALIWWLFITYIVDKLRNKFNPRGLKAFNRVIGTILILVGIAGILSGAYMKISGSVDIF